MTERKTYVVTDRAGEWVAGQRRPESGRIVLTERQAAYELTLGNIAPLPMPAPPKRRARRGRQT